MTGIFPNGLPERDPIRSSITWAARGAWTTLDAIAHPRRTIGGLAEYFYRAFRDGLLLPTASEIEAARMEMAQNPEYAQQVEARQAEGLGLMPGRPATTPAPTSELGAAGGDNLVVDEERRAKARRELVAFGAGVLAGGVTGTLTRTTLAAVPRYALEGAVFGATEGALTPLEEKESRAERIITGTAAGAAFTTVLGSAVSGVGYVWRKQLVQRGVKPEVDVPELAPMSEAYNPIEDAIWEPVVDTPAPYRQPITDPGHLLPLRRTDPRALTIGAQESIVVDIANQPRLLPAPKEQLALPAPAPSAVIGAVQSLDATNTVALSMRDILEAPVIREVVGNEITKAAQVPMRGGQTAFSLVKAEDNLGFDKTVDGLAVIVAYDDWQQRWPAHAGDDISAKRYAMLQQWRDELVPRLDEIRDLTRRELRTEGTPAGSLTPLRGGMTVEQRERGGRTETPSVPPTGGAGGAPPPPGGVGLETAPQPEPAGGGAKKVPYGDAVKTARDKISVKETVRDGRKSWDWYYTQFIDELWPLNKAVDDLLVLRKSAAKALEDAGIDVEVLGTDYVSTTLARRGAYLKGEGLAMLPEGGGPLVLHDARGRAITTAPTAPKSTTIGGRLSNVPGFRLPALHDPYVLARLSRGSLDQAIEMLENGTRDFHTLQPNGPSFREVVIAATQEGLADQLRAFLLAPRSLDFAARGMTPPIPVEVAQSLIANAPPRVVQLAQQYFLFRDNVLKYLKASGAISDAAYTAIRKASENFVSFERFFEETAGPDYPGVPPSAKRVPQFKFKAAEGGGEAKIVDPFETIIRDRKSVV